MLVINVMHVMNHDQIRGLGLSAYIRSTNTKETQGVLYSFQNKAFWVHECPEYTGIRDSPTWIANGYTLPHACTSCKKVMSKGIKLLVGISHGFNDGVV